MCSKCVGGLQPQYGTCKRSKEDLPEFYTALITDVSSISYVSNEALCMYIHKADCGALLSQLRFMLLRPGE